jgi:NADPH2:quinone reductase
MRAYALESFGDSGTVREVPDPEPAEGQVRVRVQAAGVNPFDSTVAKGLAKDMMEHRFPLVPGIDAAGEIVAVGPGVEGWNEGDEIFGSAGKPYMGEGTFADFVTMSVNTIARRPVALSASDAAGVPTPAVTAMTLLDAAEVKQGQTLVVVGASGGVGGFTVQLGAHRGVRVLGVASGANDDYVRQLGADMFVDHTAGDVPAAVRALLPDGFDALIDLSGSGETVAQLAKQVKEGGHVASATGTADVDALKERGITGTNVNARVTAEALEKLAHLFEERKLQAPPVQRLPLERAGDALALVGGHHVRGKVVIAVE